MRSSRDIPPEVRTLIDSFAQKIEHISVAARKASNVYIPYSPSQKSLALSRFTQFNIAFLRHLKTDRSFVVSDNLINNNRNYPSGVRALVSVVPDDFRREFGCEYTITLTRPRVDPENVVQVYFIVLFSPTNQLRIPYWDMEITIEGNNIELITNLDDSAFQIPVSMFRWWNITNPTFRQGVEERTDINDDLNSDGHMYLYVKRLLSKSRAGLVRYFDSYVSRNQNYVPIPATSRSTVNFARSLSVREARTTSNRRSRPSNFTNAATLMRASELSNNANSLEALYVRNQPGFFTLNSLKKIPGQMHPLTRARYGKSNIRRAVRRPRR